MADAKRLEPPVSEISQPFWDGTRDGKFLIQWCTVDEKPIFYPREACPTCLGRSFEWRPSTGKGTVYAVSVQHKPRDPFMASRIPYPVALVELDEGVRFMTNVIGVDDPYDVVVGQPVQVTWEPLSDGRQLPLVEPAAK